MFPLLVRIDQLRLGRRSPSLPSGLSDNLVELVTAGGTVTHTGEANASIGHVQKRDLQ